jgi:hypothetical protein
MQQQEVLLNIKSISVDETTAASLRGISVDTQRRHRKMGIGPKAFWTGSKRPRYWLEDIEAEQAARNAPADAAA